MPLFCEKYLMKERGVLNSMVAIMFVTIGILCITAIGLSRPVSVAAEFMKRGAANQANVRQ